MKNAHGVEPTRFMKREESKYAIGCDIHCGPIFGSKRDSDLLIGHHCNEGNSCYIHNDGTHGYECHTEYKSSLFVNSSGSNEKNYFSIINYEVFGIDYENRDNIYKLCKYPDIIWKYIDTRTITESSLKQFDDDIELLKDLDAIHCEESYIRLKISHYYFKNPSEFLPNTQLVNQHYDSYLREWLGNDYKWKLIYRASEHGYTAQSFHECCDDKGPTLVIIKSSGGWIFGGYTTQLWSRCSIYNDNDILTINRRK